jgi:predicted component of type VI protein secretion system
MDHLSGPTSARATFVLIPVTGDDPVVLADHAVVGRMNTCDVSIQDKSVSREHARLSRLPSGYLIEDLNSTNGTLVNGNRISDATVVHPGDVLTFGTVDFRLESAGEPDVPQGETSGAIPTGPAWGEPEAGLNWGAEQASEPPAQSVTSDAVVPVQPDETPSPLFRSSSVITAPVAGPEEVGRLADEVVAASAHLSGLAQRLAEVSSNPGSAVPAVPHPSPDLDRIRDIVDSVPASPLAPDQLQEVREVLVSLAANPKDVDLLMRVRDAAPQLAHMAEQYAQLEAVLTAVGDALDGISAG